MRLGIPARRPDVRRLVAAVTVAAAGVGGALAGAQLATGTAAPRDTLVVASLQDVDSLNPFVGSYASSVQLFHLMYDYLTDYDTDSNLPAPGLAASWSTSPDGRTWTFHLRDGLAWSDGVPLTAGDVVFTYRTLMRRPGLANASAVRTMTDVAAPDPRTVVVTTSTPTATMLSLDVPIVPEHVWSRLDPGAAPPDPSRLVGSGPFRLAASKPGEYHAFDANPRHWRGSPRLRHLVVRRYGDSDAAATALRSGEVDLVSGLTPAQADALGREVGIAVSDAEATRIAELGFNPGAAGKDGRPLGDGHPALRDVRVRAAVEHAIDRPALVARVLGSHGIPGSGYLPVASGPWGWAPDAGTRRDPSPARAAALLDEAGYRAGPDGVRVDAQGRRLALRLLVPTGRAHYAQSARYIAEWLRAVGIDVTLRATTDSAVSEAVLHGRYDLYLGGWVLDPDPDYLLSVQTCDARPDAAGEGSTDTFACDPRFDNLYARQVRTTSVPQRVELVHRMQALLYEDVAQVVLYYPAVLEAHRTDRVEGLLRRPAGTGSVAGAWSYRVSRPVAQGVTTRRPAGGALGGAAGAVLLAGGVLLVLRRLSQRDDRP